MVRFLKEIDFLLVTPALLLSSLGLLLIFSTSFESDPSFFVRQAVYIAFSLFIFLVISRLDFKAITHLSPIFYVFLIGLLVLTFVTGVQVRGSVRWIDLGFITVQGSELAKPILVLTFASFLTRFPVSKLKYFLISIGLLFGPLILIARQPDLSNSLILFATWAFIAFMAGISLIYVFIFSGTLLLGAPFIWNFFLKGYQKARLISFFNPNFDPQGANYNVVQALIALGSGQLTGRGLGRGTQFHLDFLPEGRTDFIFSVAGEELGFIGLGLIIILLGFLISRVLKIALSLKTSAGVLFCYGAAFLLSAQFFINAAMNMGIFPVSGITLPFISFGGSSITSMFILIGLVQSAKNSK